jgi:hypothetical protein
LLSLAITTESLADTRANRSLRSASSWYGIWHRAAGPTAIRHTAIRTLFKVHLAGTVRNYHTNKDRGGIGSATAYARLNGSINLFSTGQGPRPFSRRGYADAVCTPSRDRRLLAWSPTRICLRTRGTGAESKVAPAGAVAQTHRLKPPPDVPIRKLRKRPPAIPRSSPAILKSAFGTFEFRFRP